MSEKIFGKINIKTVISILAMYPCTKFQLIWKAPDFGIKFAQKNVNNKNFGKVKFDMRI